MARKSDIFGSNPFPKFYRDTDKAFGTSTRTKPTRSNSNVYPRSRNSYGNNRDNNSRVDVFIHDHPDDHGQPQTRPDNKVFFILLIIGIAIYAVYWVLNQIWQLIVSPIILFIISIKYYVILTIYLIGFVIVTMYLEKKDIVRPYSFLGGILASGILALSIMAVFGLI